MILIPRLIYSFCCCFGIEHNDRLMYHDVILEGSLVVKECVIYSNTPRL